MRAWLLILIMLVLPLAAHAQQPASMSADQAYVRAVALVQTELAKRDFQYAQDRASAGARSALLERQLTDAMEELKRLRALAQKDDGATQALMALATDQRAAAFDWLEQRAQAQTHEEWKRIGALAAWLMPARAINAYEHVVECAPDEVESWLYLAELYNGAGQIEKARLAIEAARKEVAKRYAALQN